MPYVAPDKDEREYLHAQGEKRCGGARGTGCQKIKPHPEFHTDRNCWDNYSSRCRVCRNKATAGWQVENQDQCRERARRWHAENREIRNAQSRQWRENNPGYSAEWCTQKREEDPLYFRIALGMSRARQLGCEVEEFDSIDLELFWLCNGINPDACTYCPDGFNEHLDHVVPLSRGGAHAVDNVVPSCAACNLAKSNRTADEFRKVSA